jgi:hypothetical protein
MRCGAWRWSAGLAVAWAASIALAQPLCPGPAGSAPTRKTTSIVRGNSSAPPTVSQVVDCGPVTISLATAAAPLASSALPAKPEPPSPKASESLLAVQTQAQLLRYAMYGAGALLVLALILLAFALLMSRSSHGIAVNRDDIRFGGAGRGFEMSPALVGFVAAAVVALMAVLLAMQVIEGGNSLVRPPGGESAKPKGN